MRPPEFFLRFVARRRIEESPEFRCICFDCLASTNIATRVQVFVIRIRMV